MSQRTALDQTIEGRDVPPAVLELARGLAAAVDTAPENAALWREYRAAVNAVMEVVNGSPDDDDAAFLESVSAPIMLAEVRNKKNA